MEYFVMIGIFRVREKVLVNMRNQTQIVRREINLKVL